MKTNKGLNKFLNLTEKTPTKKAIVYNYERYENLKKLSDKINDEVRIGKSAEEAANDFAIENPTLRLIRFNDFFNNFSHFSILD
tara:strand:- start:324 stop:575 length:252 start_codon:yes stop_codon:yes gene_type:complete